MKRPKYILAIILSVSFLILNAQTGVKVLFDARKAQMAGNADWIVDADVFNLGPNSSGAMVTGAGNEANPQRFPTPAQSGISQSTAETYWKGGNSAWAVALAKLGFAIETLPYNGSITYGVTTNAQDLSNYKVFICNEPNIKFTTAEKAAILQFVQNGGGLFMISDHTVSDRNNDNWDSPAIWNDLMNNNGISTNPFGISFDLYNFSQTTTNFAVLPSNTILHGSAGNPTSMKFSNGTSMTLNKSVNSNALGLVFKTGYSNTGSTGVMMATSKYGTGKIVGLGDSSPADDGTGDLNDVLYNGWTGDVSGNHSRIITNATIWLSNSSAAKLSDEPLAENAIINLYPNPADQTINIAFNSSLNENTRIRIFDVVGQQVLSTQMGTDQGFNLFSVDVSSLSNGTYFVELANTNSTLTRKFIKVTN